MKKKINSKGYFLAETIVVIALVTTIVAYVFPNVMSVYNNYKNTVHYYDQTKDIYTLKATYEYLLNNKTTREAGYDHSINLDMDYISYYTYDWNFPDSDHHETYPNETGAGCKTITSLETIDLNNTNLTNLKNSLSGSNIENLYIASYMSDLSSPDYNFNLYLKRLKKNTSDSSSYRLIGVFNDGSGSKCYASIKIENPAKERNCNLGG